MQLPAEVRAILIGLAAMVLYFAVAQSSTVAGIILSTLFMILYVVLLLVYDQRARRQ